MLKSDNFDELLEEGKRNQMVDQEYEERLHDQVFNSASGASNDPEMSVAEAYRKGQEALEKETTGVPSKTKSVETPKPAAVIKPAAEKEKSENKLCPNFPGGEGEKCMHPSPIGLDQKNTTKTDSAKPKTTLQKFDQLKVSNSPVKNETKVEKPVVAKPKTKEEIIIDRQSN